MGTCSTGIETSQLIEIQTCLNKQNQSIQTLLHSTKNEIKNINDRIIKIEKQIENILIEENNPNNNNKIKNNKINNYQRKFPKPRTVKLHSKNIIEENNDNQQLLNAISLKMDCMRNMIRNEMNNIK